MSAEQTDRELLEAAAKAAGIELRPMEIRGADGVVELIGHMTDPAIWPRGWFSPLTDDGDALRLAVKLGMHCVESFPVPSQALIRECGGDEYAATRRAIVRAAAEQEEPAAPNNKEGDPV